MKFTTSETSENTVKFRDNCLPDVGGLHGGGGREEWHVRQNDVDVLVDRARRNKLETLLGAVGHRRVGTVDDGIIIIISWLFHRYSIVTNRLGLNPVRPD